MTIRLPPCALLASLLVIGCLSALQARAHTDSRCLLSFDSARLNVCNGESRVIDPALQHLADPKSFEHSNLRVVKFGGPIHPDQRQAVEQSGARILGYAPHHAYVIESVPLLDVRLRGIRDVLWVGPFLPAWKVDPNIARDFGGSRLIERAGIRRIEVILHTYRDETPLIAALARTPELNVVTSAQIRDQHRLLLDFNPASLRTALDTLVTRDDVATVSLQWAHASLNSQGSWLHQSGTSEQRPLFDHTLFGCGEVIGVADTGVNIQHCSFSDPEHTEFPVSVCANGSDCSGQASDSNHRKLAAYYKWSGMGGNAATDVDGHGTHVAGSAVGSHHSNPADCSTLTTPGNTGNLDGMAPGARLVAQELGPALEYLNSLGGTLYHAASVAYDNGARIHSNSWGSSCRSYPGGPCLVGCQVGYRSTSQDADAVVWDFPELAIFAAAGNSGGGCGPGADVYSPGNAKNVFSIGANLRGTDGESMWGASSRGPTEDRRSKPDLIAQGAGIVSAAIDNACGAKMYSGTSMATPTAAGAAALIREYLRRGFYPTGMENANAAMLNPSASLIKAIMINGAHPIGGSGSGGPVPNTSQGWGQVRLVDALHFAGDMRTLWLADMSPGLQTGHLNEYLIELGALESLLITLVWHDYPALVHANPHGVNRLRLEVETPSGEIWTQKLSPNGGLLDPNPYQDNNEDDYDDRNNVHQLYFASPEAGTYRVVVRGIQVAMGGYQPYALAASGVIFSGEVVLAAAPVLGSVAPHQVIAESGGFTLTASGTHFSPNATLYFAGLPLVTTYIDENTLHGEVPWFLIEEPGDVPIHVSIPEPGGGNSDPVILEVLPNPDRVFRNGFEF